jgi:hypothetical protein
VFAEPRAISHRAANQRGTALVLAMLLVAMLTAVTAALVPLATTERTLVAAAVESTDYRYAAESAMAYAIANLQERADWSSALDGSAIAPFSDTTRTPNVGGRLLNLDSIGATLPTVEPGSWGADRPRWTLFAWGPARGLSPGSVSSLAYLAVWVADDERDGDGNARRDANGRLTVRADAFGPVRGRRSVVVAVARQLPAPAALRILDWRLP